MARVFVTGSADGLGKMAARLMIAAGHEVVLHARNPSRAKDATAATPGAAACVIGDLSTLREMRSVAEQVNALGRFDAVIHNAALGYREPQRIETENGLPQVFAVNTLAPYVLTVLIERPRRLVYMSSGMHRGADGSLRDLLWKERPWNGSSAYADTKLHDTLLAFAVARLWGDACSNAVDPGWVPTRMGGPNAPGDLDAAPRTQVWLATSDDPAAQVSGRFFYHMKERPADPVASDPGVQDRLLKACATFSGLPFPAS